MELNSILFEGTIVQLLEEEGDKNSSCQRIAMHISNDSKGKLTIAIGKSLFSKNRVQPKLKDKVRVIGRLQEDSQGIYIEIEHLEYRR